MQSAFKEGRMMALPSKGWFGLVARVGRFFKGCDEHCLLLKKPGIFMSADLVRVSTYKSQTDFSERFNALGRFL